MKGFAALPLIIILVALALVGGGIYLASTKVNEEMVSTPTPAPVESPIATVSATPSASPSATPTPKPTIAPTKKPTPVPTAKPTATAAPQAAGPSCPSGDQKGDLVVNVQKSGGTMTGETTISLSCGGKVQKTQVIPNG